MSKDKAPTARFISKYRALKIVMKASYTKEVDGRVVHVPGESIRFRDGIYETGEQAVIDFLEARPEFGELFIRVPDNVDAMAHRAEHIKDLETREAELARKEAELKEREAKLNASEEGAPVGDGLDKLKKADLLEICEKEGVEDVDDSTKNADLVAAIRANREKKAKEGEEPAY